MSGWQKGDLALCLNNTPTCHEREAGLLVVGRIYRVAACGIPEGSDKFCLAFNDIPTKNNPKRGNAYSATRFRKIKPDTEGANEYDAAWLKDLLSKPKVSA